MRTHELSAARAPESVASGAAPGFAVSERLQSAVGAAVRETVREFAKLKLREEELAVSLVDLSPGQEPLYAGFRDSERVYPASVIKLFYLAAAHAWMEAGRLADTPELRRAMRDMIVDSHNEATGLVVDSLTGTTSGPELPPAELEVWYDQRNAVNRHFAGLGYTGINVNRKPWCEGPYGREMQSVLRHEPNHRNWLTTRAAARLMTEIATNRAVSPRRSGEIMALLKRDPFATGKELNSQARFIGAALPPGSRLWSKAGWTSQTRHDAAYLELPGGSRLVLVIFTVDHAHERDMLTGLARRIINVFERA